VRTRSSVLVDVYVNHCPRSHIVRGPGRYYNKKAQVGKTPLISSNQVTKKEGRLQILNLNPSPDIDMMTRSKWHDASWSIHEIIYRKRIVVAWSLIVDSALGK
jgi:hypothetical protein